MNAIEKNLKKIIKKRNIGANVTHAAVAPFIYTSTHTDTHNHATQTPQSYSDEDVV